jgi:two-component system catabolic regulation response regulator CreB
MPQTILIIEDEVAIADTLSYALTTEGFHAKHVCLGQTALDLIQSQALPDLALIVLDVGLPDLNGFEVCRRLRQFCTTPIIFLTARSEEIDRIVGLEIGADDYVTKPFSPRELVARIRAVLRRQSMPIVDTTKKMKQSRFELRSEEAKIVYFGTVLNLTRYEYLLLKTLLEKPEHLFTRSFLMEQVWSDALSTSDRTVDTHIKSLRAKLKAIREFDEPIQTHRSMGYSISAE